jgi:hypothetical protein
MRVANISDHLEKKRELETVIRAMPAALQNQQRANHEVEYLRNRKSALEKELKRK